jgi:hypothetical protein
MKFLSADFAAWFVAVGSFHVGIHLLVLHLLITKIALVSSPIQLSKVTLIVFIGMFPNRNFFMFIYNIFLRFLLAISFGQNLWDILALLVLTLLILESEPLNYHGLEWIFGFSLDGF